MSHPNKVRGNSAEAYIRDYLEAKGIPCERAWGKIPGFGRYSVSSDGLIRRDITSHTGKSGTILKPSAGKSGYLKVSIRNDAGEKKNLEIHRAVAIVFVHNAEGKPQVNHIDCNIMNNSASNLEWVTPLENIRHGIKFGRIDLNGQSNPNARLSAEDVIEIRRMWGDGVSGADIARRFSCGRTTVGHIVYGRTWRDIP